MHGWRSPPVGPPPGRVDFGNVESVSASHPPAGSSGKPVPLLVLRAGSDERKALLSIGHPFFASRASRDRIVVVLTGETDWEEIRELVIESYRILAPKKLTALLD